MSASTNPQDQTKIFTIQNNHGTILEVLNYGAAIFSFQLKDKNGKFRDVVVTPAKIDDYFSPEFFADNKAFGASVGRYAGRISEGKFLLNGSLYELYTKNGVHLHGGYRGFHYKIWQLEFIKEDEVKFSYLSPDGEESYPGNLQVSVTYKLTSNNELRITYEAQTDKTTPVNLTNHSYFNLQGKGNVGDQELQINASELLETTKEMLPTGNTVSLKGHGKNFENFKKLNEISLDDTFVLNKKDPAVILSCEESGIKMTASTNQPAVVVYSPPNLPEDWDYKTEIDNNFPAICFEFQNFPDAPNHTNFPNSILEPGAKYLNESVFSFEIFRNSNL